MERPTSDAFDAAWFLAGCMGEGQAQDDHAPGPDDRTPPNVIIAVSLDELDGMTGDMLV